MKNNSTPSKGWDWENELLKKLRRNVDLDLDWIFPYIHKVIYEVKQEDRRKIIDKAQQEITDWSLERQEKAYRMGIDIGRQEERREIQKDIKSVLNLLDGDTPKNKIANYIREYLEEE
jgi:hypothetical protein